MPKTELLGRSRMLWTISENGEVGFNLVVPPKTIDRIDPQAPIRLSTELLPYNTSPVIVTSASLSRSNGKLNRLDLYSNPSSVLDMELLKSLSQMDEVQGMLIEAETRKNSGFKFEWTFQSRLVEQIEFAKSRLLWISKNDLDFELAKKASIWERML